MNRITSLFTLLLLTLSAAMAQHKTYKSDELIPVASFGQSMVIGLSVTSTNRLFVSFPNYNGAGNIALAEVKDGAYTVYPDTSWNRKGSGEHSFVRIQDLYVDAHNNLWVLDSKPNSQGTEDGEFKLVKINTTSNTVEKVYTFDDLDLKKSALNDVRIDVEKNLAYFSDPGLAAIVILDLISGQTRVVLANSTYTSADDIVIQFDGLEMRDRQGQPFSHHVNSIALTKDFKYFYFKPINKHHLYRIATHYLADKSLSDSELAAQVEDMGKVGITHGMEADAHGNIYLTSSESYSISYLSPDRKLHVLVQDSRLLWPDSLGIGSDGYLYFSCAQLQRLPEYNQGINRTVYPYEVYRVKMPIP